VVREPKSMLDTVIPCEAPQGERVETNGDECNHVGEEIGTSSKRETT